MLKQLYFVMPLSGALRMYEGFEKLFDFYPGGVKGLILEYLFMYSIPVGPSHWDGDRRCDGGTGTMEDEILEKVIAKYETSWNYLSKQHSYPNCQTEFTIEMVCNDISRRLHRTVQEHRCYFQTFEKGFNPDEVVFFGDTAAMKVSVRLPALRN